MLHHGVLCSRYSGLGKNVLLSLQIVDVPTHLPLTVWGRSDTFQLPKNKTNKHNSRSCYQCPCWQPLWKASISETWSHLAALFVSSAVCPECQKTTTSEQSDRADRADRGGETLARAAKAYTNDSERLYCVSRYRKVEEKEKK